LIEKWSKREESEKSWAAEKKAIEENDYILSASAYKPGIGGGGEEHRDPKEILKEIESLGSELEKQKRKIKSLV
jgi:hypothetical protein